MKTFEELGLTFDFDEDCATCQDGSCHNIVTAKNDGREYSVHISTNTERNNFEIFAVETASTGDSLIEESFENEEEAVKFVCDTFNGFKCF